VTADRPRPIVLVVLDGFGIGRDPAGDAIAAAPMPTWRGLLERWPHDPARGKPSDAGQTDVFLDRKAQHESLVLAILGEETKPQINRRGRR